jgi:hypothetical protein
MADEVNEVVLENGKQIFVSADGSAVFEDGSPAIEKVIEPDHHRFTTASPDDMSVLIESGHAVIT